MIFAVVRLLTVIIITTYAIIKSSQLLAIWNTARNKSKTSGFVKDGGQAEDVTSEYNINSVAFYLETFTSLQVIIYCFTQNSFILSLYIEHCILTLINIAIITMRIATSAKTTKKMKIKQLFRLVSFGCLYVLVFKRVYTDQSIHVLIHFATALTVLIQARE